MMLIENLIKGHSKKFVKYEIKKYAKNKYNISEEDVQAAAEDLGILDVEPESKTKH